jgi:[ribosomal protein S5]-alanine N-acetyltransferase
MQRALLTERLRLEPPRAEHLDALVDIHRRNANEFEGKVVRIITHRDDAARWLIQSPRGERYVIVVRKTKQIIGMISLTNIDGIPFSNATLGYWIDAAQGKQGFAREAAVRVIEHGFTKHKLHRIEASIEPSNRRSIKLIKALGFRLEGVSPRMLYLCGAWRDQKRFALLADEWTN